MKLTDIKPKEGLKIRRKNWTKDYFWYFEFDEYFNELVLKNCNENMARIGESDLTNDWEIFNEVTIENINKRYKEFKHALITPNIINIRNKDLRMLKKATKELDWSYMPEQLFGMKIVINNNLTRGEFLLKYVKEETLSDKVQYSPQQGWVKEKPNYPEKEVIKFANDIKRKFHSGTYTHTYIQEYINKKLGDRLNE